jgi:cytochrome P450
MPTLFWFLAYVHVHCTESQFLDEILKHAKQQNSSKIDISDIDFHKLLSSELLQSGLKETLRLQAHNISPRNLEEDTSLRIDGRDYLLKKGTLAFAPSTLVNWSADIYKEPKKWKAERFVEKGGLQEQETKYDMRKLKMPLLVWGGGSHAV